MSGERLCVATCGEKLDWIPAHIEACIYDATGTRPGLIHVPNEAREASQYLRHIVTHYGAFRDYEIFLQGDPAPHHPGIVSALRCRPWLGKRVHPLGKMLMKFDRRNRNIHTRLGVEIAEEFGIDLPDGSPWTVGAMFAASREALMSRPLAWWERLLAAAIIEREHSPWVMERLWLAVMRGTP